MPGPPKTLMSSLELPPLSDIGMMLVKCQLAAFKMGSCTILVQSKALILGHLSEHIHEIISSATSREDHDRLTFHFLEHMRTR